jgi:hypothetical protein
MKEWGIGIRPLHQFEYYRLGHNVLGALLFENVGIDRDNRNMETVVFGGRYGELRDRIGGMVVGDLVDGRRLVKEKGEIENSFEIRMTWAEYFRLRTVVRTIVDMCDGTDDGLIQLGEFMDKGKVRCKKLRMVYDGKRGRKYKENNPNTIASLRTLWGARIEQKERKYIEWNLRIWTITVLEAKFKDFCFKLLHGRLYLNLALSHFSDTRPGCTFCRIRKKAELVGRGINEDTIQFRIEMDQIENETDEHFLWTCRETNNTVRSVINRLAGREGLWVNREKYFEGTESDNKDEDTMVMIVCRYIQYVIYKCKHREKIPSMVFVYEEVHNFLERLREKGKWIILIRKVPNLMERVLEIN